MCHQNEFPVCLPFVHRMSSDVKSPTPDMDEVYVIPVEVPAMDESLLLPQSVYPVDNMDGFKQLE